MARALGRQRTIKRKKDPPPPEASELDDSMGRWAWLFLQVQP